MIDYNCPVCGGKLNISISSEFAKCENCDNSTEVDAQELIKIKETYNNACKKIRLNSYAGLTQAMNQLQAISFVSEAQDKIAFCEKRLNEIKETEARRTEAREQTDKNDTKIGIIILILFLLVIALAIGGAVYIIHHLRIGDLSPKATAAIITVIIVFAVITVIGKVKS